MRAMVGEEGDCCPCMGEVRVLRSSTEAVLGLLERVATCVCTGGTCGVMGWRPIPCANAEGDSGGRRDGLKDLSVAPMAPTVGESTVDQDRWRGSTCVSDRRCDRGWA